MATFLFNFKPEFAVPVEMGTKRQTIRANRRDSRRPVRGDTLKLYQGLRTRNVRQLRAAVCTGCVGVRIYLAEGLITVDGRKLEGDERTAFAVADGFATWPGMLAWFAEQYGDIGDVFEGFCVQWGG